uniref:HERC2 n=1 Tax=Rhinopithecus bieti TaxID=61621 RepID=A0A2K6JV13_RHIBE
MPSESFCLAAQARLDSKWLKTDTQLAFTRDGLCGLWNEMVKDGEIVYTGTESTQNGELPPRKDDSVEPSGTKKEDMNDKEKKDEEETPAPVYRAKSILESWVWGKQPDVNELKECLSVLVKEQQALAVQSATTTLSALRLKQRLVILERYFIALNRTVFQENVKVKWKSSSISLPPVDKKSSRPAGKGVEGLARVGSRAALSFAFAFLRRAWRSGTFGSATVCPSADPMCSLLLSFLACEMRGCRGCLAFHVCALEKKKSKCMHPPPPRQPLPWNT